MSFLYGIFISIEEHTHHKFKTFLTLRNPFSQPVRSNVRGEL